MHVSVLLLHTLCAKESLGNHLHFYLRTLHAIPLADHSAKGAVARELRVARHEQVAEIHRIVDIALNRIDGGEETRHLLNGIRYEYRLKVVAILQTATDAGGNSVNVLQHRRILDADNVRRGLCLDKLRVEHVGKSLRLLLVGTTYGEIRQTFECHLLSVRRSADARKVLLGHVIHLMEVLRAGDIVVGNKTFNCCHDELIAQSGLQLLEMVLQIRRRHHEHKRVVSLHDAVDVAGEEYLIGIEVYTCKIIRIMAYALELLYAVVASHIPPYVMGMTYHNFGNGSCPTASANNCYFSAIKHLSYYRYR